MKRTIPPFFFVAALVAHADVAFDPIFTDDMVLQRDVEAPVWGTAAPGETVSWSVFPEERVTRGDYRFTDVTADENGGWRFTVRKPATLPGCSWKIAVRGADGSFASITNVLFGDVWLCSGQSNMDMNYGWGLTRGKEDIESNTHPRIRLFDDVNRTALLPQADPWQGCKWTPCDPAHAKSFSAVGYFFGQALQEAMPDVPIGLIEASWSGSPIQTWVPYEEAEAIGGDFGAAAAARRALAADWANGGAEKFETDLAAWMEALPALDPGDAPAAPDFDDADWATATLPEITEKHTSNDFNGYVWYRRTFVLDEHGIPVVETATLSLGPIDDQDWTYVNGVLVGSTNIWDAAREYVVPENVLRPGTNVVAVKVLDWGGHAGFWKNDPAGMKLTVSWSPDEAFSLPLAGECRFKAYPAAPRPVDLSSPSSWDIAACHNGMIAPLFGMAAKGAIWYQGCSDVGRAALYEKQFPAMVEAWRRGFVHDDAGFPVYLVQLASFMQTHAEPFDSAWARMRWTQMRLGETVPHCGTAVALDVGDHGDIHPKDKKTVGERLARLALARTHGCTDVATSPLPLRAAVDGNNVAVSFLFPGGKVPMFAPDEIVSGFELAGADGVFVRVAARTAESRDHVLVPVPDGMAPAIVRYAWDDFPAADLATAAGLPVGPFEILLSHP